MGEARHSVLPAESLVEQVVQRKRRKPLLAPDHLGNLHQVVIDYVREMVGRKLVSPFPEHLVVERAGIDLHVSADEVVHLHDPVLRHLEADGPVRPLLQKPPDFVRREAQGIAQGQARAVVVDESLLAGLHLRAYLRKFLGGVESVVGVALFDQFLGIFTVDSASLALPVRRVRMLFGSDLDNLAVLVHALVRNDSAPVEGFDDVGLRPRNEPLRVRVLNPDDEISAVLFGVQIVIERCPDSSHMERACRRRRESHSCSSFHSLCSQYPAKLARIFISRANMVS